MDDEVGNTSVAYTQLNLAADNCPGIDSKSPKVSGVTFIPGDGNMAGVDSSIVVTISTSANDLDLVLNAITFNGQTIGSITNNNNGKPRTRTHKRSRQSNTNNRRNNPIKT